MSKPITAMIAICAIYMASGSLVYAKDAKPLFQEESLISITIEAPFSDLIKNAPQSTEPYAATLKLHSDIAESHSIELSARGRSRRSNSICKFPPLRVEFDKKPKNDSLFDGQKRLKLVTHCRANNRYQQYYLLEYSAYKLFNTITDDSLKVRLAEVEYFDTQKEKTVATQYGFFIEDTDDAAKRLDKKEIDVADISVSQLSNTAAANYSLFQYMIGNLDWSMHDGPEGSDCCHNTKLIGAHSDAQHDLIPVPYDFDYSGLVNASYALPPEGMRVSSVRTRRYRGFCVHDSHVIEAAANFRTKKDELLNLMSATPALSKRSEKNAKKYLEAFFRQIDDESSVRKNLLADCRD